MTTLAAASASSPLLRLVDPGVGDADLSVEDLGSRIVGLAGRIAAATCQWLLLVARFDQREGCAAFGLASTARWLTHACGLSRRAAADHVRVARALAGFPVLASAMSAGRVSYSHVRAIARVAKPGEQRTVADLLEVAQSGTVGQLETIVRGLRTVEDLEDVEVRPAEYVRTGWSSSSQWQLSARLDPERGALIGRALEVMRAAEGLSPVEALERVAEVALAVLDGAGRAPVLRGDERAAVVVHLDLPTARAAVAAAESPAAESPAAEPLAAEPGAVEPAAVEPAAVEPGAVEPAMAEPAMAGTVGEPASEPAASEPAASEQAVSERGSFGAAGRGRRWWGRIAQGPGLPDAVIERMLCQGRVRVHLHRQDGSLFDLGRSRRLVSTRLFRALLDRDGGCTHPGCGSREGLEAHHVRHWLYGGRTDLANLVLLCRWHHHAHHRGEFSVGLAAVGGFVFRRPDGRVLPEHVDPSQLIVNAPVPLEVPAPCWTGTGQRLDRDWAIAVLAQRRENENAARLAS